MACASDGSARELITDPQFRRGFILSEPKPGKHVRYGEIRGFIGSPSPLWGLSQWSSKFPLEPTSAVRNSVQYGCSNSAKGIVINGSGEITMIINSRIEYGPRARKAGDPWVHLLVEQEFKDPAQLAEIASATLRVNARLLWSRNLHDGDYSPDTHAAQFQIFFTVQNRNRQSPGHGDLLWFGVPLYDNRSRFPNAHKARDFGGTEKFIFTPAGETFMESSSHDGQWIVVQRDLLPLMREALQTAWAAGFLKSSKDMRDYAISGMNMGWELPGTFDVAMQVRGLSLTVKPAH